MRGMSKHEKTKPHKHVGLILYFFFGFAFGSAICLLGARGL
jgi:hypothetical protein